MDESYCCQNPIVVDLYIYICIYTHIYKCYRKLNVDFHFKLYTSSPLLLPDIKGSKHCCFGLSIYLLVAPGQLRSRHSPFCCSSPLSASPGFCMWISTPWLDLVILTLLSDASYQDFATWLRMCKFLTSVSTCHIDYPSGHVPNWLEFNFNCLSSLTFQFLCSCHWAVPLLCLSQ